MTTITLKDVIDMNHPELNEFLARHIELAGGRSLVAAHDLRRLVLRGDDHQVTSSEALGQALFQRAEREGLRLGGYLDSPEGDVLATAVGYVIPSGYHAAYALAVEGLRHAAELARQGERERARRRLVGTAVAVGGVLFLAWAATTG